jgi:serine/threonine protein kinase
VFNTSVTIADNECDNEHRGTSAALDSAVPQPGSDSIPDFRSSLQRTLAGSYTIERELGGGGMSSVYLAEETALGRRVVIKILPPELAHAVNGERFRQEIRFVARLPGPWSWTRCPR